MIVQALKADPALPVTLDLFGVTQGEAGNQYATEIADLIANDSRIRMLPPSALCRCDIASARIRPAGRTVRNGWKPDHWWCWKRLPHASL